MIVYDKTSLENYFLIEQAEDLKFAGFITNEQNLNCKESLKGLKTQKNLFIRLGFFILGILMYSSSSGLITFFTFSLFDNNQEFILLVVTLLGLGGLEFLSREKYYGYGLDDAFLLGFLLMLGVFIGVSFEGNELLIALILSVAAIFTFFRYLHLSSALIACLSLTATVAYISFEIGSIGKSLLPFIMMLFASAIYFISKNSLNNLKKIYYYNGILLANSFALLLFYLAGNYLVVRELSVILLEKTISKGQDIPFAIFFYAFTLVIPLLYIVFGLKSRNRIMLWIGFLAFVFSIYSIRHYYSFLNLETEITIGGILLFAFAYFAIKKLRGNEMGLSFKPNRFANSNALTNAEIVLTTAQFGIKSQNLDESPMQFGDGDFSGGGSSGNF